MYDVTADHGRQFFLLFFVFFFLSLSRIEFPFDVRFRVGLIIATKRRNETVAGRTEYFHREMFRDYHKLLKTDAYININISI